MRGLHVMNKQYKKIFSVLLAILLGSSVILFALQEGRMTFTGATSPENDSEWKDTLTVIPQNSPLKTANVSRREWGKGSATTTVDIVSRELLFSYALAQRSMSTTTMSDDEALAVAQTVIGKIEIPKAKQYSEKDLIIINDNSSVSLANYSQSVGVLTKAFILAQKKTDIDAVLTTPVNGNDSKRLAGISENIALYDKLIKGLLATKTPSIIAPLHLRLVQKYANIKTSILPMAEIFTDPLKGLRAFSEYNKEVEATTILAKEFQSFLSKNR